MSGMRRIAAVTICGEVFDLALGSRLADVTQEMAARGGHVRAAIAREGVDLYGRPVALEVDLESELAAVGNVAFVESLLLLLATTMQERDAALAAARRAEP